MGRFKTYLKNKIYTPPIHKKSALNTLKIKVR